MRISELTRYLDKYIDRGSIGDKIDALQDNLAKLREMLPEAKQLRDYVPEAPIARARALVPYGRKTRSYTLPAALAVGGVAILGAIVVTAVMMSDANRKVPKRNEDMH